MIRGEKFRIPLSVPLIGDEERRELQKAMDSGWLAPAGPTLASFEEAIAEACGSKYAVAVSSGTAALHLSLLALAPRRVVVPTLTFAASAFPVVYVGAEPVFVDVDFETWCIDLELLESVIKTSAAKGQPIDAVMSVDLFGRMPNYSELLKLSNAHGFCLIEDAAEALGSEFFGKRAGSWGDVRAVSFNGNKIVTTGGGGAVLTDSKHLADRARHLASQARSDVHWFEHHEVGFNYRMSNIQAAVGLGQISRLRELVDRRRFVNQLYRSQLETHEGVRVISDPTGCYSNCWLTNLLLPPELVARELVESLHDQGIEARMNWKPMHLQPVFAESPRFLNGTADELFRRGLCLPSGPSVTEGDTRVVSRAILNSLEHRA